MPEKNEATSKVRSKQVWTTAWSDSLLSTAASLLAVLLVRWLSEPIPGFTGVALLWTVLGLVAWLLAGWLTGNRRVVRRRDLPPLRSRLIRVVAVKEVLLAAVLLTGLIRLPSAALSVVALLSDAIFTTALIGYVSLLVRMSSETEIARVRNEASRRNALVQGTGEASVRLAREMEAGGAYAVVGFLTDDPSMAGRIIDERMVVFCASQSDLEAAKWRLGGVDAVFMPREADDSHDAGHPRPSETADVPIPDGMDRLGHAVKRTFDVMLSLLLLVVFAPVGLICAAAIWLEDGGPVFFRQERIGRHGRPFQIVKFRSMRTDAEAAGAQLAQGDQDPRLTRAGAFLRRHHLDELPQLWNVLRGDMSFIGPRPEREVFIGQIMQADPRYRYLYQIRPGVTSYATLYNGYTDTLEKMLLRLDLDLYYLRHHSVPFDARVLGLTFLRIISGSKF